MFMWMWLLRMTIMTLQHMTVVSLFLSAVCATHYHCFHVVCRICNYKICLDVVVSSTCNISEMSPPVVACCLCNISCLFPYCSLQYLQHISIVSNILSLSPCCSLQYLQGLASWLPPEAGMFMWMKLEGGVKDADDIIDALKDEQVAVVPGQHHTHQRPNPAASSTIPAAHLAHALFDVCKCEKFLSLCRC